MAKLMTREVLRYSIGRRSQGTVRAHFLAWRASQSPQIPLRCDIEQCQFFHGALTWNDQSLKLILDHINGVAGDNRPKNLRFLCPNCNSQQATHGGSNKGKVQQNSGGFSRKRADGKRNYTLVAESGHYELKGNEVVTKHGRQT